MKKLSIVALGMAVVMPFVASAQSALSILVKIQDIVNFLVPLAVSVGVLYFIWGVIQYTTGKSDDAKKEGRERMIWGIIGLFVIVSMWGLVNIIGNTFEVRQGGGPERGLPCVDSISIPC